MLFSLALVLTVGLGEAARAGHGNVGENAPALRHRHLKAGKGGGVSSKGKKGKSSAAAATTPPAFGQFEVWASDQSNSVAGETSRGVEGSFLWIWDSEEIKGLVATGNEAATLPCTPNQTTGPCDVRDVFPASLTEFNADGAATGNTLGDLDNFGRLHGMLKDPTNRYVTANLFAPDGGYVGIIDTLTKEAISLFRITEFSRLNPDGTSSDRRSNHMSFFSEDGTHIIIANLLGKAMERIDIERNAAGIITQVSFNKSASLGLGSTMSVANSATFFKGNGAFGTPLLGQITGDYTAADLGNLTPNGVCKENGCGGDEAAMGGRPNNVIICPVPSKAGLAYITLGGGGLLVAEIGETPMKIVGEYGNAVVYGAGCGGVQVNDGQVFLNAGVSASGAGANQSMFSVQSFSDSQYPLPGLASTFNPENTPMPNLVYQDTETNTASGGNVEGPATDETGQLPHLTTRRDSHGAESTLDGKYVHVVDRIQNVVEVFNSETYERTTYDLTSTTGKDGRDGPAGACYKRSVLDDAALPLNDPAPDLLSITPDGNYLMIAFRGPAPVSVTHSAQGSCPGVGIVQLTEGGKFGKLVEVLRTTNTIDTAPVDAPGGVQYAGAERSDVHAAMVVARVSTTNVSGKGSKKGKGSKRGKGSTGVF